MKTEQWAGNNTGMNESAASMLEQNGRVVRVTPTAVLIETERQTACGHCHVGEQCGTSVIAQLFRHRSNQLRLKKSLLQQGLELQAGDEVVIGIAENLLLRAALWAYMVPILSMLGFALLIEAAGHADIFVFLAAMVGLFSGLYLSGVLHTRSVADEIVLLRKRIPKPAMASIAMVNINVTRGKE